MDVLYAKIHNLQCYRYFSRCRPDAVQKLECKSRETEHRNVGTSISIRRLRWATFLALADSWTRFRFLVTNSRCCVFLLDGTCPTSLLLSRTCVRARALTSTQIRSLRGHLVHHLNTTLSSMTRAWGMVHVWRLLVLR